ncbi:MAG: hypothetical protein JJU28_02650 [Cyclobacteriaceae bacterium]|nr:hypothetical protein [Cyclobacteriaceae bacterium]
MKNFLLIFSVLSLFASSVFISACTESDPLPDDNLGFRPTPYTIPEIPFFPTRLNIPSDNPMTEEGIKLGRYLFYDGRLSGRTHPDSLMSCATCHVQEKGFKTGIDHPRFPGGHPHGIPDAEYPEGKRTHNFALALTNAVYNQNGYFWNGYIHERNTRLGSASHGVPASPEFHHKNIESIVWMTVVARDEINGSIEKTVNTISSIPIYPPMFKAAFGTEEVNMERINKAIAQFVRSIISYRSKFHKYLRSEVELTTQELRGHDLFFSEDADCFHCHAGTAMMTTLEFFNNAKDTEFNDPLDRYSVTGNPMDRGAYRAPSLINVEVGAPFMHDGRFKNLDEVIEHYSSGVVYSDYVHPLMKYVREGGVQMSQQMKDDLKAFLLTLTDHEMLSDPSYSRPSDLQDGSVR